MSIRDHGLEIAFEKQVSIFKRFERGMTSRNISGLGLGLFIAREIMREHGGEISLVSQEGEGSTFVVRLPLGQQIEICAG